MITILYIAAGKRAEHTVATQAEGNAWVEDMCLRFPADFCITTTALHQTSMAFGDECVRTLRLH